VLIGNIKIKIKVKEENQDVYIAPEILAVCPSGTTLSFVSRRDPLRDEVDLWTSTQQGFKIKGWRIIWEILKGIRNGLTVEDVVYKIKERCTEIEAPDSIYLEVEKTWRQIEKYVLNNNEDKQV
jgi:hypothetical protein